MISENELTPDQKYKMEQVLFGMKKNKRNFVKKYGMKAEALMKKRALKIAKQYTPEPTVEEMENDRLKKLVQDALSKPLDEKKKSFPDLTGDGKVTKADILKGRGIELDEDLDLGHEDDEPHMLKADLYRIGKYAMELYQMVDQFEGEQEVDFPHWWQAKIIHAKSCLVAAKHYLDFELKEPQVDTMVGVAAQEDVIDEKLKPSMGAGEYVKDFEKSDAPQFKGKSKKKKQKMAVAAYLSAKDKIKEAIIAEFNKQK